MAGRRGDAARRTAGDGDVTDVVAVDDGADAGDDADEASAGETRACLDCGSAGRRGGACPHLEVGVFASGTAAVRAAAARVRETAAAHRQAVRALRALATGERARGRARIEC